jgi:2-isopropylmalate synthase
MQQNDWIYDWNLASAPLIPQNTKILLNDETLRDGLQNPSVHDPNIEDKIRILHLMESLGIESVNIGLPGAGPRAAADVEALAREIAANRMKIRPNCAARTVEADIRPIAEISQRAGIAIEAATFLGSSPIRRLVEDWSVDHLERTQ